MLVANWGYGIVLLPIIFIWMERARTAIGQQQISHTKTRQAVGLDPPLDPARVRINHTEAVEILNKQQDRFGGFRQSFEPTNQFRLPRDPTSVDSDPSDRISHRESYTGQPSSSEGSIPESLASSSEGSILESLASSSEGSISEFLAGILPSKIPLAPTTHISEVSDSATPNHNPSELDPDNSTARTSTYDS